MECQFWVVLESVSTTLAVLLALFLAFLPDIRQKRRRPILDIPNFEPNPPDCIKIPITKIKGGRIILEADSYYVRLRVINTGKTRAENVEVFAKKLSRKQENDSFKEVNSFLPLNLQWAHMGPVLPGISPDMERHISIFGVIDPSLRNEFKLHRKSWSNIPEDKTVIFFNTDIKTNDKGYLQPFGTYRLELEIGGSNCKPVYKIIEITVTGDWFDEEQKMFSKGIDLKIIE